MMMLHHLTLEENWQLADSLFKHLANIKQEMYNVQVVRWTQRTDDAHDEYGMILQQYWWIESIISQDIMVKQCQRDDSMVASVDQTIDVQEPAAAHSYSGPSGASVGALEGWSLSETREATTRQRLTWHNTQ